MCLYYECSNQSWCICRVRYVEGRTLLKLEQSLLSVPSCFAPTWCSWLNLCLCAAVLFPTSRHGVHHVGDCVVTRALALLARGEVTTHALLVLLNTLTFMLSKCAPI